MHRLTRLQIFDYPYKQMFADGTKTSTPIGVLWFYIPLIRILYYRRDDHPQYKELIDRNARRNCVCLNNPRHFRIPRETFWVLTYHQTYPVTQYIRYIYLHLPYKWTKRRKKKTIHLGYLRHFQKRLPISQGMFPKIVGFPPKSSILRGCSIYFHHPFWGTLLFGSTPILPSKNP